MIVTGQVHGGLAQGIGQALMENCAYDENGQLLSASYMDYAMPRASDVPFYAVITCQTPYAQPIGRKENNGEAGAISSTSVVNAVVDALQSAGHNVTHIECLYHLRVFRRR